MTDLPYTYTDRDDDSIAVGVDHLVTTSGTVRTPTGADAAAFARAVLAAAGDTGHVVLSRDELTAMRRADARSMRERAAETAYHDLSTENATMADRIRALPLLPDGDDTEDTGPPPCAAMSPVPGAPGLPYGCEGTAGHEGDHYALRGSVKWGDTEPAVVHVATPEGITPCGDGTRDVTTSPLIPEVTCVGCLQALALEKGGQVIEMRDERDRLRTAWESARRRARQQRDALREAMISETDRARRARDRYRDERNTARAELADARRWGRILEEQRKDLRKKLSAETNRVAALRIAYQAAKDADLPEEDMVEPGDEVSDRVGALEQQYTDLANLVHGHGEDLTRLRRRFTEEDDG